LLGTGLDQQRCTDTKQYHYQNAIWTAVLLELGEPWDIVPEGDIKLAMED
jgi:hypothetical protein